MCNKEGVKPGFKQECQCMVKRRGKWSVMKGEGLKG